MSASRIAAAWPVASAAWWRSTAAAIDRRQAPAADQHGADESVVDAELAALAPGALLGRLAARRRPPARRRRARSSTSLPTSWSRAATASSSRCGSRASSPIRSAPMRTATRVAAEALVAGSSRPGVRACRRSRSADASVAHAVDVERLDRLADPAGPPRGPVAVVGGAHHGDRERGVRLDRLGDVARRGRLALARARQAPPRLRTAPAGGDGVERGGEAASTGAGRALRASLLRRRAHAHGGFHRSARALARGLIPLIGSTRACLARMAVGAGSAVQGRRERSLDRALDRSRPSAASESKIPGETVVPVIATRSGW